MYFADVGEVLRAYDNRQVELGTKITVRLIEYVREGVAEELVPVRKITRRDHGRPRAALGDPAQGPAVRVHEQGAEEERKSAN
jgi:DNA-directed RNA polymerase subunit beta'